MNTKISVIIPVYNGEAQLNRCLDSVLRQTLAEIEVLCVDDGSTDQSLHILKAYAEKDARVHVIEQENSGAGVARNNALANASGVFVAFMDSDDKYPDPTVLEKLYEAAVTHETKIAGGYCNIIRADYEGPKTEDPIIDICMENPEGTFVNYKDFQYDFNYQGYIYDRKFLTENDIKFPPYRRFQDPPFFVKAMICAKRFFAIPVCTYCYYYTHQAFTWNAEKINDMVCGHIDNLILSKEHEQELLHKNTVAHLEHRYKDLIADQLNMDNLRLYALCAYANSVTDFDLVEKATKRKRRVKRLHIMEALDDRLAKLLILANPEKPLEDRLEDMMFGIIKAYETLGETDELSLVENLIGLLGRLLMENRSYEVRRCVYEFQKKALYNWLINKAMEISEKEFTFSCALQKLNSLPGAVAFTEKLKESRQDRECDCIYRTDLDFDPLISVIIPVYNVEAYLRECLDSVVNQTLKKTEIICVDDGSTDKSFEILMEYAKKYENITVLQQKNAGLSVARNSGMSYANGRYIHFLDSDDSVKIDAYEKLITYADTNNLDVIFFDGQSFYETKELQREYPWYKNGYTTKTADCSFYEKGEIYFEKAVYSDNFKMHAGMYMAKRAFVEKEKLSFIPGILHEDNYYTVKMTLLAGRTGFYKEAFYNRRVRRGSLTIVPLDFRHVYGYFITYIKLYEFLFDKNYEERVNEAVWLKLRQIAHNGMASYTKIEDVSQQYYYLALPTREMIMFQSLFVDNRLQLLDVKETLKETKVILQRTYDEKFDRGVEIKRLKKELENSQKELSGVRNSKTYRIARAIGFPIRVARKLFRKRK